MKVFKLLLVFWVFGVLWSVIGQASATSYVNAYGYGYTPTEVKGSIVANSPIEAWNIKKVPVAQLVKKFGYNWKTDRVSLAAKVWISPLNYRGTAKQNMLIKEYFKNKVIVKNVIVTNYNKNYDNNYVNKSIPTIKRSLTIAKKLRYHTVVYDIAKEFGFYRPRDRFVLAKKLGIVNYNGTRAQNMIIRSALINNIIAR